MSLLPNHHCFHRRAVIVFFDASAVKLTSCSEGERFQEDPGKNKTRTCVAVVLWSERSGVKFSVLLYQSSRPVLCYCLSCLPVKTDPVGMDGCLCQKMPDPLRCRKSLLSLGTDPERRQKAESPFQYCSVRWLPWMLLGTLGS